MRTNDEIFEELKKLRDDLRENNDQFLTHYQAANFLFISQSKLYKMTSNNEITYYKPNGKKNYYFKSDLIAFIKRNRIKSNEKIGVETMDYMTDNDQRQFF